MGEIADIPLMAAWLRECGLDMLQLLPLNEMTTGQNSPYGAMSALALDPIYISVARVPEFRSRAWCRSCRSKVSGRWASPGAKSGLRTTLMRLYRTNCSSNSMAARCPN